MTTERISFRASKKLKEKIEEAAEKEGMTPSQWIRKTLQNQLEKNPLEERIEKIEKRLEILEKELKKQK